MTAGGGPERTGGNGPQASSPTSQRQASKSARALQQAVVGHSKPSCAVSSPRPIGAREATLALSRTEMRNCVHTDAELRPLRGPGGQWVHSMAGWGWGRGGCGGQRGGECRVWNGLGSLSVSVQPNADDAMRRVQVSLLPNPQHTAHRWGGKQWGPGHAIVWVPAWHCVTRLTCICRLVPSSEP